MKKNYNYKDLLNKYIKTDNSSPEGLFQLALMHFYGNNYPQDIDKTITIINEIGPNYPEAFTFLGIAYLYGEGIEKDIDKGIAYLEKAAANNDCDAILLLSNIYLYFDIVPKDYDKAIALLNQGVSLGYDAAMVQLGIIIMNSPYIENNLEAAYQLFIKADALGNPNAAAFLGLMHQHGDYVTVDKKKAFQYFLKAASGNSEVGHFFLGRAYYQGEVIKKNTDEAMHHFIIAAEHGYSQAIYQLIDIYFNDPNYYDINRGRKIIDILIKKQDPYGYYFLGSMQIDGTQLSQDIEAGIENLKKAQIDEAYFLLGQIYNQGVYTKKDDELALNYFLKSADLGNIDGMVESSEIIINNQFEQDFITLLETADDYDHPKGSALLGECYLLGRGVKTNIKKAFTLFQKAAKQKNKIAYRYLGFCYHFGINVTKDEKKATHYYYKAINNHDFDAAILLHGLNNKEAIAEINLAGENVYKDYLLIAAKLDNEEAQNILNSIDK